MLTVRIARSEGERSEVYRFRRHVFGELEGYLEGWRELPGGEETDAFDRRGESILFAARDGDRMVGGVRLLLKRRRKLPIERHVPAGVLRSAGPWAEASRLCVLPGYRGSSGAVGGVRVVDALCKMYFTYAMHAGIRRVAVVANANRLHPGAVQRTNGRMGFRPVGGEFFLRAFNEYAIPMAADLDELPERFVAMLCEDWPCIERPWNFCLYPERNFIRFWDQFAVDGYDGYRALDDYRGLLERADAFVGAVDSLADVGCGTGNFLERMLRREIPRLVAIDASGSMLAAARERCGAEGRVRYCEADARAIPLPDRSVDGAVALNLLFHFADPVPALREMSRISRTFVVASGPLRDGDPVRRLAARVDERDSPALRYNRILVNRRGLKFLPDAVAVARAGRRAGLRLSRYETAYDGIAFIARFDKAG